MRAQLDELLAGLVVGSYVLRYLLATTAVVAVEVALAVLPASLNDSLHVLPLEVGFVAQIDEPVHKLGEGQA